MCLSKAYIERNGEGELLMEEVASLKTEGGVLVLNTLFGEQREVRANIRRIDFLTHSIFLEDLAEKSA